MTYFFEDLIKAKSLMRVMFAVAEEGRGGHLFQGKKQEDKSERR